MSREKAWETFKASMKRYADEHPEFSLDDFIFQRLYGAYVFWREARQAERFLNFEETRRCYLKAVESIEQAEKLLERPEATLYLEMLKTEYYQFVVHRDPNYRLNLKHLLPLVRNEPGILQTQTYERLQFARSDIMYTLYFAEKEGLIRREKKGRSYQLFFVREKPADEPLLNIQDDEIDMSIFQKNNKTPKPKPVPVNPEDQKIGCLTITMVILILVSFFIGLFGFITLGIALFILVYLCKKTIAIRKAAQDKAEQAGCATFPKTQEKIQDASGNQEKPHEPS
jgi:hypothetical protein